MRLCIIIFSELLFCIYFRKKVERDGMLSSVFLLF